MCVCVYVYAGSHSFVVDSIASPHVKSPIKSPCPRMPLEPVRFSLRTHGFGRDIPEMCHPCGSNPVSGEWNSFQKGL